MQAKLQNKDVNGLVKKEMRKGIVVCVILSMSLLFGCGSADKSRDLMKAETEQETVQEEKRQHDSLSEEEKRQAEEEKLQKEEEVRRQTERQKRREILIAIDPGHQGPNVDMTAQEPNAPGSDVYKMMATGGTSGSYTGIPEYQLNLDISLMLKSKLEELGYSVILTREDHETAISNSQRACMANEAGADISIRIHANGSENPGASGALALIGSAENPYVGTLYEESYRMAETVLNSYCESTGMVNLGVQCNDTMTGINWSEIPVMILEMGFMTNQQDDENMADSSYRELMVEGIVNGLESYFGF